MKTEYVVGRDEWSTGNITLPRIHPSHSPSPALSSHSTTPPLPHKRIKLPFGDAPAIKRYVFVRMPASLETQWKHYWVNGGEKGVEVEGVEARSEQCWGWEVEGSQVSRWVEGGGYERGKK